MSGKKIILFLIILVLSIVSGCSNSDSSFKNIESKINNLAEQNKILTERIEEQQKVIQEILEQQKSQHQIHSDIQDEVNTIRNLMKNNKNNYISEEQAMEIAKEMNGDSEVSTWEAELQEDYVPEHNIDQASPSPTWIIKAIHPFGNKTIFYIDAISREIVSIAEIENKH